LDLCQTEAIQATSLQTQKIIVKEDRSTQFAQAPADIAAYFFTN